MKPNYLNFLITCIPELLNYKKYKNIKFENPDDLMLLIDEYADKGNFTAEFGCSWSTVEYISRSKELGFDVEKDLFANLKTAFDFIINELKIKTIRIGCYWDRIETQEGIYKLDKFLEYELDILTQNEDINIIMNLGPIKTFRWPEKYIPSFYSDLITEKVLRIDSKIVTKADAYLKNLIKILIHKYGKSLTEKILYTQFNNEPFNVFGDKPVTMSTELEAYFVNKFNLAFEKDVMVDGPLIADSFKYGSIVKPNLDYILELTNKLDSKVVFALNYYYDAPNNPLIPILNISPDHYFIFNSLYPDYAELIKTKGVFMISEAQFEPWGDRTEPGNSFQSFGFMTSRTISQFAKKFRKYSVSTINFLICLWGVEGFTAKLIHKKETSEHIKIKKVISGVNTKNENFRKSKVKEKLSKNL